MPPAAWRNAEIARTGIYLGSAWFGVCALAHYQPAYPAERDAHCADCHGDGFWRLGIAEAVLSYVGVGVDPSMISFGTMINAARMEMAREPMVWWALLGSLQLYVCIGTQRRSVRGCGTECAGSAHPYTKKAISFNAWKKKKSAH